MKIKLPIILILWALACFFVIDLLIIPKDSPAYIPKSKRAIQEPAYQVSKLSNLLLNYSSPNIKPKNEYTILLLGDSMTDYLRTHDKIMTDALQQYYQDKRFKILNYGYGATNIMSVKDRLEIETEYQHSYYPPINTTDFDIIFIESFGYNPLSEFEIDTGLAMQTKQLEYIYTSLRKSHPNSHIVFVATIAPNKKQFGLNTVELSEEQRINWAEERISYIKNHRDFANRYNIPLVNIFDSSLDENGDGDLEYISDHDYIHPSARGVYFIYEEMAKFVIDNELLPV